MTKRGTSRRPALVRNKASRAALGGQACGSSAFVAGPSSSRLWLVAPRTLTSDLRPTCNAPSRRRSRAPVPARASAPSGVSKYVSTTSADCQPFSSVVGKRSSSPALERVGVGDAVLELALDRGLLRGLHPTARPAMLMLISVSNVSRLTRLDDVLDATPWSSRQHPGALRRRASRRDSAQAALFSASVTGSTPRRGDRGCAP